jgi:3-hydroxyisobutyrate dehydrogenase-like beta-hydroxyacid dehydrogenase
MRVAVLGLGRMGAPIADRLLQAGHELAIWNRSPGATEDLVDRGAARLAAPDEAWERAELVITMLADDRAVRAVVLGEHGLLTARRAAGGTLIDMSTISPETSAEIAAAAAARQVPYLRAPVSGNPSVVVAGNLSIIVSGPAEEYARTMPILHDIGPNLFHVGEAEQARIVKLALNLMIGGTTALLAEALVLAESNGLERAKMLDVIAGSAIGSPYVNYKRGTLLTGDYSSTFTARLLHKDLGLALAAGHQSGVPLALTALVQQLVEACIAQGMGDLDLAVLVPRLEREAGRS